MPVIPLTCPSCGAQLEANSEDSILTCQYCGVSSVMKDAIVHNYIQNTVNITAGTVNVVNQKDFVIEGGVLKKYQGESTEVVIPDNVVAIGKEAFGGLRVRSVLIPNSVESIEPYAFSVCGSLTSITIPDSVTKIGDWAFNNCTSLTSITIPDSVTEIGDGAFNNCTSLTSITISDSVTEIGKSAFMGCTSLTSITIPDGVTEIGYWTFKGCTSLTSITIPDSVTEIGESAFEGCTSLTSITIPDSVTKIGMRAFEGCTLLQTVKMKFDPKIVYYAFRGTEFEKYLRRKKGCCQHCGGEFEFSLLKGKVCKQCGKVKDY